MGIDCTEEREQDWMQAAAPPLKYSDLVSEDTVMSNFRQEISPHLAARIEHELEDDDQNQFDELQPSDYLRIANASLQLFSDTALSEVTETAEKRATESADSSQQFASHYIDELVNGVFTHVGEGLICELATTIEQTNAETRR